LTAETRWISLLSALTLLIGILIGIAMDRFLFRPPHHPPYMSEGGYHGGRFGGRGGERALARMTKALDLTEDQQGKVKTIFRKYMPQVREARMKGEDTSELRTRMRGELEKVLNPDQLKKFNEMVKRRKEMRERRFREDAPPAETPHPQ
jgi:Spy/CpxP family protein refolding chaperone